MYLYTHFLFCFFYWQEIISSKEAQMVNKSENEFFCFFFSPIILLNYTTNDIERLTDSD